MSRSALARWATAAVALGVVASCGRSSGRAQPAVGATVRVSGAVTRSLALRTARTTAAGSRQRVVFAPGPTGDTELVVEIPQTSGTGSLTSVRVGDYFIGDCPVVVLVDHLDASGSFDCAGLAMPSDASKTVAVTGHFRVRR